jgi:hypothetical protein
MEGFRRAFASGPLVRRRISGLVLGGAVLAVLLFGCRDELGSGVDRNRAPDTYLTGFPAESTTSVYRVHLFWYGSDYDGQVVRYEFAVTDSAPNDEDTITFKSTTLTDSVFILQVGRTQQVLAHRFYIRAIDNEGKVDPEPAWTFFGSADLVTPRAIFTRSEGFLLGADSTIAIGEGNATVPEDTIDAGMSVRFHWVGVDGDRVVLESGQVDTVGRVLSYEHWLSPLQAAPIQDGIEDTIAVYGNLQSGKYIFNLRAVDDAGFGGLDPTVRAFVWNRDPHTYFETGFDASAAGGGAWRPHLLATSEAWSDTLEFFDGDTLPLTSIGGQIKVVNVWSRISGRDPDDNLGAGVGRFQFRGGVGIWEWADTTADPQHPIVALPRLGTTDLAVQARCSDGYGRNDGTPAEIHFVVNYPPVLLDTLAMDGGQPVYQRPRDNEAIRLADLAAANWQLNGRVRALDPDGTTTRFAYYVRAGGFQYGTPITPGAEQICQYSVVIPTEWRQVGTYAIGVRVEELTDGTRRRVDLEIPFRIVN